MVNSDGVPVQLQIARRCPVDGSYYRGVTILLFCFAINDRSTFVNLMEETLVTCYNYINDNHPAIFYLVGLKSDLEAERAVSIDEAEVVASELKMKYIEVSSKQYPQGNVNELLQMIGEDALAMMTWRELSENEKLKAVEFGTKDRTISRSNRQPFSGCAMTCLSLIVVFIAAVIVLYK